MLPPYSNHRALVYFCSCAPISHTLICPCPIPLHAVSLEVFPSKSHHFPPSILCLHSPGARLHSLVGFQTIGCFPSTNHITLASSLNLPSSTLPPTVLLLARAVARLYRGPKPARLTSAAAHCRATSSALVGTIRAVGRIGSSDKEKCTLLPRCLTISHRFQSLLPIA